MLAKLYEDQRLKLWRFNPCDMGAARALRPLGRALRHLASECQCCSGARVLTVALAGYFAPTLVAIGVSVWFLAALVKELWSPTEEYQAGYNIYDEHARH